MFTILSLPTFWDKCIRVTSYFIFFSDLFQYYSTVTKCTTWQASRRSSGQNFEWAPPILYMYNKCRTHRPHLFWTPIISECTYYYALLYAVFSSVRFIFKFTAKYFLQKPHHLWHTLMWRRSFTIQCIKISIRNMFTHSCIQDVSWILDITVGCRSNSRWLWFPLI